MGQLTFKYKTYVLDTVDIDLTVTESNGHRILLNYRTTDYGIDHMYGQFSEFTKDILGNNYVISEQNLTLTSSVLSDYEAVWLPDPFNYHYPLSNYDNYSIIETNPSWADGELEALTTYLDGGGSVILCFIGQQWDSEESIVTNTNVSMINELTDQYGIHVRDTIWTGSSPITVNTIGINPLTLGVDAINHYGCSLELSGDAVQITELSTGSEYATCAYTQTTNGGRIIVLTTNFVFDQMGFQNLYNPGVTQNDQFSRNLIRVATAKHRMNFVSIEELNGTVNIVYEYLNGPGADFGGYIKQPSSTNIELNWTEIETNIWQASYAASELGMHHFYPECGSAGIDDFDYFEYNVTELAAIPSPTPTPTNTTTQEIAISLIIISVIGLAGWVLIQKNRK